MTPQEAQSTSTGERRGSDRRDVAAPLSVHVETVRFGGRTENVSRAGVFFFSEDRLRVTVQVQEPDGEVRVCSGHLVRVERMSEATTGYAIEFDRA